MKIEHSHLEPLIHGPEVRRTIALRGSNDCRKGAKPVRRIGFGRGLDSCSAVPEAGFQNSESRTSDVGKAAEPSFQHADPGSSVCTNPARHVKTDAKVCELDFDGCKRGPR